MDSGRFSEILMFSGTFESATTEELKQMAVRFPWCQSMHLVLLKKMHMAQEPAFGDQLGFSAIHVNDRSVLFGLIHYDRFYSPGRSLNKPAVKAPESPEAPQEEFDKPVVDTTDEAAAPEGQESATEVAGGKTELIDQFIKTEPRIVPRDGDFAEAIATAEKSNEPFFDLVTETLAEVYLNQGNKSKAVKIFERLSLTIPEKSSYFAARIAEIRRSSNRL